MNSRQQTDYFFVGSIRIAALTTIFLLVALLFILGVNYKGRIEKPLDLRPFPLIGFDQIQSGVFRAVMSNNGFHALGAEIFPSPHTYYRIRYDVSRLPREKVVVTMDFYASSYDNPEQELARVFGMSNLGRRHDFFINSGESPERALFRIFYSGPPGLELANIQIMCVPGWWTWLKYALIPGFVGALLFFVGFCIQRVLYINAPLPQTKAETFRIIISEAPMLLVVYFCSVLIRYTIYMTMPYWSGDEYVYKSIAAGIWRFGHHGPLTESMVSHSVDLPNLLYPYLISLSFVLGENFYFGVRLINSILFNLAIFPCYLLARKFMNPTLALLSAIFSIAIPFANLGAFAVPEVLFYPLFLLCVWVALESLQRPTSISWISAFGAIAALLLNVRLNALVLLPAFLVSFIWIFLRRRQSLLLFFHRPHWITAVIAFWGIHFLLQYLLGVRDIGKLGVYSQVVERSSGPLAVLFKDPAGAFHLFAGHFATIAIPYALPITLLISAIFSTRKSILYESLFDSFLVITSIFASALFILALAFTISVSPFDLGGLGRWHSRYYFYFYPLLAIAGIIIPERIHPNSTVNRIGVMAGVGFFLAINIYFIKALNGAQIPWFGSIADNMDVQWYLHLPVKPIYWFIIIFTAILSWLWVRQSSYYQKAFIIFIFVWITLANYGTIQNAGIGVGVRQAGVQLVHANDITLSAPCGSLVYNFLDHHPGRFVVVGDSYSAMVSATFWNPFIPDKTLIHNDISKSLGPAELGVQADYLITNGDLRIDPIFRPLISIGKCVIYEIPDLR